jgi:hypothetical protein
MASIINAQTSPLTAVIIEADNTGNLAIQTANTTAIAINSSQVVSLTNPLAASSGGTGITSPGASGNVLTSNGTAWTSVAAAAFNSGTLMLFQQTAAPTGWTKQTTHNNKALRVVSGTASTGGSVAFTTAFASQAVAGSVGVTLSGGGSVSAHTLSTAEIPSHQHTSPYNKTGNAGLGGNDIGGESRNAVAWSVGATGGGGAHSHGFTNPSYSGSFTGTAINLAVQYVDLIIASKD